MIVFMDGPQMAGKTTLIRELTNISGFSTYKFPFTDFSNQYGLTKGEGLKGFQLGKDLALTTFISFLNPKKDILIDRGPLSSVYYSWIKNRMSGEEIKRFCEELSYFTQDQLFVFITSKNRPSLMRDKKDGYDDLEVSVERQRDVLDGIFYLCSKEGLNILYFENDFLVSPEGNAKKLLEKIEEARECLISRENL